MNAQPIPINKLDLDPDYYVRKPGVEKPDWQTVERYADAMRCGQIFPPLYVTPRNGTFVVLDGWTRTHACKTYLRSQGVDPDTYQIPCVVDKEIPVDQWYAKAAELNMHHGRPLSMQERIAIADRLHRQNWSLKKISDLLAIPVPRIKMTLSRVHVDEKTGKRTVLKGAQKDIVVTARESNAAAHTRPIHSASIMAAIDNLLALLRSGVAHPDDPVEREKLKQLHKEIGALLRKK